MLGINNGALKLVDKFSDERLVFKYVSPLEKLFDSRIDGTKNKLRIECSGYYKAPASGTFTFYAGSDDGTKLHVDGE